MTWMTGLNKNQIKYYKQQVFLAIAVKTTLVNNCTIHVWRDENKNCIRY